MIEEIKKFFIGALSELQKVVWPSRNTVISHTVIVVIATAVAMAIVTVIDLGLFTLVQWLIYKS